MTGASVGPWKLPLPFLVVDDDDDDGNEDDDDVSIQNMIKMRC